MPIDSVTPFWFRLCRPEDRRALPKQAVEHEATERTEVGPKADRLPAAEARWDRRALPADDEAR